MTLKTIVFRYQKLIEEVKEVEEPKVVNDIKLLRNVVPKKVEWKAGFITYKPPSTGVYF